MPGRERLIIEQAGFNIQAQLPKGGAAGDVLTKNSGTDFDASFLPATGGSGPILTGQVVIPNASLRAFDGTPATDFTIIPSPGAGFMWMILSLSWFYRFGTIPFTTGGEGNLYISQGENSIDNSAFNSALLFVGFLDQLVSMVQYASPLTDGPAFPTSEMEDVGVTINIDAMDVPYLTGDGDLVLSYLIQKIAVP
jgi:hypothetical protein